MNIKNDELKEVLAVMERYRGTFFSFRRLRSISDRSSSNLSYMQLRYRLYEMVREGILEMQIHGKRNKHAFYRLPVESDKRLHKKKGKQ